MLRGILSLVSLPAGGHRGPGTPRGVPPRPGLPICRKSGSGHGGLGHMGANWIRGKISLLRTNRITEFSAQFQRSRRRGLCRVCPRWGQPGLGISPPQFLPGSRPQLVRAGVALPRASADWDALGTRRGAMAPSRGTRLCPRHGDSRGDTGLRRDQAPPGPAGRALPVPVAAGGAEIKASIQGVISRSPRAASVTPARC